MLGLVLTIEKKIMTTIKLLRNIPDMLIILSIMLGIVIIQMIQRLIPIIRGLFSNMIHSIRRIWRSRGILKIDD